MPSLHTMCRWLPLLACDDITESSLRLTMPVFRGDPADLTVLVPVLHNSVVVVVILTATTVR